MRTYNHRDNGTPIDIASSIARHFGIFAGDTYYRELYDFDMIISFRKGRKRCREEWERIYLRSVGAEEKPKQEYTRIEPATDFHNQVDRVYERSIRSTAEKIFADPEATFLIDIDDIFLTRKPNKYLATNWVNIIMRNVGYEIR
jgi:hypothetical protein